MKLRGGTLCWQIKEKPIGIVEIILIGIALSADAMSVTICNLVANPQLPRARALLMPLFFGLFQGLMPALGFFAGSLAADVIERYAGLVALVILGFIGGKMIWDGLHPDADAGQDAPATISVASIVLQAVATSIDAFAVGVTFAATGEPILLDACIIAACTFVLCVAMVALGRRLGEHFGDRAQIIGGIVLVLIGLRAFFL